jgi:outer membrane protein OmpA-like peptidoglycan-associated protein
VIGTRHILGKRAKDDGEKPFWISFADLMSALMVLFLLVMSVALLAVTKTVTEAEVKKIEREQEIEKLLDDIEDVTQQTPGVTLYRDDRSINLGPIATFEDRSSALDISQASELRKFVGRLLPKMHSESAKRWLQNIQVVGYTSLTGDYLYNLNLSLERSQRLVCVLLADVKADETTFTTSDLVFIRDLFLVSGYAFNSAKATDADSRRIELRLNFYGIDEVRTASIVPAGHFGQCRI